MLGTGKGSLGSIEVREEFPFFITLTIKILDTILNSQIQNLKYIYHFPSLALRVISTSLR